MVEVGYQGNKGTKIQRMYGFNKAVNKSGPNDKRTLTQRQPFGANVFGVIQTIGGGVNSNYNSLALKVQQRMAKGVTYLIGYTWSRAIDSGSAIRTNSGDNLFPTNNYDFSLERGLSQFHSAHRLTASIIYQLPIRFNNRILQTAIGGWQTGSIITIATGNPFNGGGCGDLNQVGEGNRGDATGISLWPDTKSQETYFARNPVTGRGPAGITCSVPDANGVNQLTYRSGNVNRNVYISPGLINWDFSMIKTFMITERTSIDFRFESFNFPNHPNWNSPSTSVNSLTYGRVTSARTMRVNQFAMKFLF
jgi:hypothetical protein